MVVEQPAQPGQLRDDAQRHAVELHLLLLLLMRVRVGVPGFHDEARAPGDVGAAFWEGDGFEHADCEGFAFGFEAEDVEGEVGEGACGGDDGGGVGEDGGAAGVGEGFVVTVVGGGVVGEGGGGGG